MVRLSGPDAADLGRRSAAARISGRVGQSFPERKIDRISQTPKRVAIT